MSLSSITYKPYNDTVVFLKKQAFLPLLLGKGKKNYLILENLIQQQGKTTFRVLGRIFCLAAYFFPFLFSNNFLKDTPFIIFPQKTLRYLVGLIIFFRLYIML